METEAGRVKGYYGTRSLLTECVIVMFPLHFDLRRASKAVNAELDYYMQNKRLETGVPGKYIYPIAKLDAKASQPGRLVYHIHF
jgi:hypothetical protein